MSDPNYSPMIYNPGLGKDGDDYLYLPLPLESLQITPNMKNETAEVQGCAGELLVGQQRAPVNIEVAGMLVGWEEDARGQYSRDSRVSRAGAMIIVNDLEKVLQGEFRFYRTTAEYYDRCVLQSVPFIWDRGPDVIHRYSLSIRALNPVKVITDAISVANPYEPFIHGNSQTGGTTVVTNTSPGSFSGVWPGQPGVCVAGQEHRFTLPAGGTWNITRFDVAGVSAIVGSGSTSIVLASAGVGGGGTTAMITLGAGVRFGSVVPSAWSIAGGSTLYVYIGGAATYHADILYTIQFQRGTA